MVQCNSYQGPYQSQSRKWIILSDFGLFSANSGHYHGRRVAVWSGSDLLSPNNLTQGHLIENRVVGCQCNSYQIPCQNRKCIILDDFEHFFCQIQAPAVAGEPLCDLETFS